ncbi:MAG: ABC transporter permease [Campylobacteraceae bacterium]|jgi:D-methionine transport system permease protein|nr:ABC transporter permease [Campylobacteraceae bacterium]
MSLSLTIPFERYANAFLDTLVMSGISGAITFFVGIPLAVLLVITQKNGFLAAPKLNAVLGWIINGFRATPFIVLLVALIPFTKFIVGTTIGVWAAIVPMTISASPFFARIAEVSLREVDNGLIEAAQAMGCNKLHIIWYVLLPEALPGIIGGFTVTLVSIINASAMAGAVGAGGLGDLALRYGYQRFDTQVMIIVIAVLIALVCFVQLIGDSIARYLRSR